MTGRGDSKRLAFVDLLFSWPPNGGADVDLYQTLTGLQALGHDVRLFLAGYERSWERGSADIEALPFPVTRIDFTWRTLTPRTLSARFREAVDAWHPDAVFLYHGFFLKPYVADALAHYPTVARYYAYEVACPRDLRLFKDGGPCPNNYLRTPNECRRCAVHALKPQIAPWRILAWAHEYLAGRAFLPGYHRHLTESLGRSDAIIVSNDLMKDQLAGCNDRVRVFPGGVDVGQFDCHPPAPKAPDEPAIILMAGRVEDPPKGLDTLREAGALLARDRSDFEIQATHSNLRLTQDWFKAIGWHDHDAVMDLHRNADICVVPSIWEEPFGLAAVEAMAAGRPVCASRVGGLQRIVRHEETGFLVEPGDAGDLARRLAQLLDDPDLRARMGRAGRRVAEEEYDWRRVIERHWPPLLERLLS